MCKIEGCESKLKGGYGYCSKHYQRFRKYGDPLKSIKGHATLEERFWRFVDKRGEDECWDWAGQRVCGYGRISIGARGFASEGAHRVSWQMHNGKQVPDGMFVMHSCDNPGCVNPKHLSVGTPRDNFNDMVSKGRRKYVIPLGEQNGKAIITKEIVLEIRASNLKHTELARKYGVSPKCIQGVRSFRTWKHVKNAVE